jgi:hypothetical protein
MGIAPLADDGVDLLAGARVVLTDFAPGAESATEPECELGAFPKLTFRARDCTHWRGLVQHAVGDDAINVEILVTAAIESSIGVELPLLARQPAQHPTLDRAQISRDQHVAVVGAERGTRQLSHEG